MSWTYWLEMWCFNMNIWKMKIILILNLWFPSFVAYYGCCKTKLMARGDMCCGSKVHKQSNLTCCGNETFDQQVQWCEENKEILGLSEIRCGNIIYNIEEKMCCEETVNPGTKDFLCCGSKSYNRTVRDCSQGNIVKKGNLWHPSCKYTYIALDNNNYVLHWDTDLLPDFVGFFLLFLCFSTLTVIHKLKHFYLICRWRI